MGGAEMTWFSVAFISGVIVVLLIVIIIILSRKKENKHQSSQDQIRSTVSEMTDEIDEKCEVDRYHFPLFPHRLDELYDKANKTAIDHLENNLIDGDNPAESALLDAASWYYDNNHTDIAVDIWGAMRLSLGTAAADQKLKEHYEFTRNQTIPGMDRRVAAFIQSKGIVLDEKGNVAAPIGHYCPKCHSSSTTFKDSRETSLGDVREERTCNACGETFSRLITTRIV